MMTFAQAFWSKIVENKPGKISGGNCHNFITICYIGAAAN